MPTRHDSAGTAFREDIDASIRSFAESLEAFRFDKAKDSIDSMQRRCPLDASNWLSLLAALSALVTAERSYYAVQFLAPKGFLRKESALQASYEHVAVELASLNQPRNTATHLGERLRSFTRARRDMIRFYEKLSHLSVGGIAVLREMLDCLGKIQKDYTGKFSHPQLDPVQHSFNTECEIMKHLITAHIEISSFRMLEAVIALEQAQMLYSSWTREGTRGSHTRSTTSWLFFTSVVEVSSQAPQLCVWMSRYQDALLRKFTLHFHTVLEAQSNDFKKDLHSLGDQSFQQRTAVFCRKHSVALVYVLLRSARPIVGFALEEEADTIEQYYDVFVQSASQQRYDPNDRTIVTLLASQQEKIDADRVAYAYRLRSFTRARRDMIRFYEKLSHLSVGGIAVLREMLDCLGKIQKDYTGKFSHPQLDPVQHSFNTECEIMKHLITAHIEISSFRMLEAVIALEQAQMLYSSWTREGTRGSHTRSTTSWLFFTSVVEVSSQAPQLCVWMSRYQDALLRKFTLHFHTVLEAQSNDFKKDLHSLGDQSFQQRTAVFCRKHSVALVYVLLRSARPIVGFALEEEADTIEQYYDVFVQSASQQRYDPNDRTIVTLLASQQEKIDADRVAYAYREDANESWYAARLSTDVETYILLCCTGKRAERDSSILAFITDFTADWRLSKVFAAMLKPAA